MLTRNLEENAHYIIRNYLRAKDDNKPHLMKRVFSDSATLEMKVNTDNISFPSKTIGIDKITRVLVRDFNHTYENVYTFCLSGSFSSYANLDSTVSCDWLVCMTERNGGSIRIGTGRYDWYFNSDDCDDRVKNNLAKRLIITIENMVIRKPAQSKKHYEWIEEVPYPFCESEKLVELMPDFESLDKIKTTIKN